jgi:phenylalanyl-tRNA synthetase beta chain
MKISYSWLKEFIDLELSPAETAEALTRVGLAVEGIEIHKDDHVLDIDLTTNRSDCLSHLGIARELGAITSQSLKNSFAKKYRSIYDESELVTVSAPEICSRFTARVIEGVNVGPSPQWLIDRLESLGERSINNIADVTNYVMLELGQPMHAFDRDRLSGGRLIVRRARKGEKLVTLDEIDRHLDESMLAICDAEKPVAIAGVMGGLESGITEETTNVLLEVAYFKRDSIRQTSRKLNLTTEASYRFERGVDIENLIRASDRAVDLIIELAGGNDLGIVDIYPEPEAPRVVRSEDIRAAVSRLTALDVAEAECERILNALGIQRSRHSEYSIPTWRHDITIEEDLVEEIARHVGYENIEERIPPASAAGEYLPNEMIERRIRCALNAYSFDEVITYSFIDQNWDEFVEPLSSCATGNDPAYVSLRDSVIENAVRMRASCLPGLIETARHNFNHQNRDLKLFEIGKVFIGRSEEKSLPLERKYLSLLMTGEHRYQNFGRSAGEIDFFDLKGVVETIVGISGRTDPRFESADLKHFRAGQAAVVKLGNITVGYLGRMSDSLARQQKFKRPVYLAELDLDAIFEAELTKCKYSPIPNLPVSERDITFIVARDISSDEVMHRLNENRSPNCVNISIYDVYQKPGSDERSITFRFFFRGENAALTDEEMESQLKKMVESLLADLKESVRISW